MFVMLTPFTGRFQSKNRYCVGPFFELYPFGMSEKWQIQPRESNRISRLAAEIGCHPVIAAVLISRNLSVPADATDFLNPSLSLIRSPWVMKDMEPAVERIVQAIRKEEQILVFGDYDVDGLTSTALLVNFFGHLDMNVAYHIPHRLTEGYGLTPEAVKKYAVSPKTDLIITVDCGSSSLEAVQLANASGIDVIITDHHEVPPHLPEAVAVLNPKRPDCPSGFTHLAGVGVALNLVIALRKSLRDVCFWENGNEPNLKVACELVALGTVADMVPLLKENRIFVKAGLEILSRSPRPGLKALLHESGVNDGPVDSWDLAFKLAPRLNAVGRLGDGTMGCQLLTTTDHETSRVISRELDRQNRNRKEIEQNILADAVRQLEANPQLLQESLVLHSPAWHEGVIGIVASRLVNQHGRPVVLISVRNGLARGSARGPEGFDLVGAFRQCSMLLETFGGHEVAAGLSIKPENIPAFQTRFQQIVCRHPWASDFVSRLHIDTTIVPHEISPELADQLQKLAPFGSANPEPVFMMSNLNVLSTRPVGQGHLKMRLSSVDQPTTPPLDAILFNAPIGEPWPTKHLRHIAFNLRWNRWQDTKNLQLVIKDFVLP